MLLSRRLAVVLLVLKESWCSRDQYCCSTLPCCADVLMLCTQWVIARFGRLLPRLWHRPWKRFLDDQMWKMMTQGFDTFGWHLFFGISSGVQWSKPLGRRNFCKATEPKDSDAKRSQQLWDILVSPSAERWWGTFNVVETRWNPQTPKFRPSSVFGREFVGRNSMIAGCRSCISYRWFWPMLSCSISYLQTSADAWASSQQSIAPSFAHLCDLMVHIRCQSATGISEHWPQFATLTQRVYSWPTCQEAVRFVLSMFFSVFLV